jgi:hypothetical protein
MGLQEKIQKVQEFENNINARTGGFASSRSKQIDEIKKNTHLKLIEELSDVIFKKNINDADLRSKVNAFASKFVYENEFPLTNE